MKFTQCQYEDSLDLALHVCSVVFADFGTDGLSVEAEINDKVKIECPKTPNTTTGRLHAQYLTFTQVSRHGFETCSTDHDDGPVRDLLVCNRPYEDNSYLLLFQQDSSFPGSLTFSHSTTYYFITTSDGSLGGLGIEEDGLCSSHHMKVKVYIKPRPTVFVPTGQSTLPATAEPTLMPRTNPMTHPPTQRPTVSITKARTTRPDKLTEQVQEKTQSKQNPDSQSSDNASTRLRHSPLLVLITFFIAMLRWSTLR
ncbi:ephrin-B2-like [Asterias rubens]|uniref:ephrin-B2-like n=1 Tax=Asterias rubens TaxID=7604 RepID=UPI0014551F3A|nr:ephrin-B2-like [Asterias rubens]